jgi:hypothetical protein
MERRGRGHPYCLELLKNVIRTVGCSLDSIPGVSEYKYELQIRSDYVCKIQVFLQTRLHIVLEYIILSYQAFDSSVQPSDSLKVLTLV